MRSLILSGTEFELVVKAGNPIMSIYRAEGCEREEYHSPLIYSDSVAFADPGVIISPSAGLGKTYD